MSDISLRFDGLIFALLIVAVGVMLLITAAILSARAIWASGDKARAAALARIFWFGAVACLASFAIVAYVMEHMPLQTGPDWFDWLALPWLAIMIGGLILLVRRPAR